jgi:flagellar motor switch protein FliN
MAATAQPLPAPQREAAGAKGTSNGTGGVPPAKALVPVAPPPEVREELEFSAAVARLPVELDVAVPVREFRVRHLLALAPGQVVRTQWSQGIDLPLGAGEVQLAWSEFEVVETRLAVRITRLG